MSVFLKAINNFRDLIKKNQLDFYNCLADNIKQFEAEFNKSQKPKGFWDNLFSDNKKSQLPFQNPMPLSRVFSDYALIGFKDAMGNVSHQYFITPLYNLDQTQSNDNRLASNTANFVTWALPIKKQANFFLVKFSTLYKLKIIPYVEYKNPTEKNPNQPKPSSKFRDMLYKNEPVFIHSRPMTNAEKENNPNDLINNSGHFKSTDIYFIVSPYYDGIPLDQFIMKNIVKLTISQKIKLMAKLAQELLILQINQHLHRDIKPGNYLVDPNTLNVMLIDGEQLYSLHEKTARILDGTTPHYLAPWVGKPESRNFSSPASTPPSSPSRSGKAHIQGPCSTVIQKQQENNLTDPKAGMDLYDTTMIDNHLFRLQHAIGESIHHPNAQPAALITPPIEFSADTFALGLIFFEIIIAPKTLDEFFKEHNITSWWLYQSQNKKNAAVSEYQEVYKCINTFIKTNKTSFNYESLDHDNIKAALDLLPTMLNPNETQFPKLSEIFAIFFKCLLPINKQNFDIYLNKVTFFELDSPIFPQNNFIPNQRETYDPAVTTNYSSQALNQAIYQNRPEKHEILNMLYNAKNKRHEKNIYLPDSSDNYQTNNVWVGSEIG